MQCLRTSSFWIYLLGSSINSVVEQRQCRDEVKVNAYFAHLEEVILESYMPNVLLEDFVKIKSWKRNSQKPLCYSAWVANEGMTFTDYTLKSSFWEDNVTIVLIYSMKPTKFCSLEAIRIFESGWGTVMGDWIRTGDLWI